MSHIVKIRLRLCVIIWNFVNWELFYRLVIDLENAFTLKILFLNHYGQVLFINVHAQATQPPIMVKPTDISK